MVEIPKELNILDEGEELIGLVYREDEARIAFLKKQKETDFKTAKKKYPEMWWRFQVIFGFGGPRKDNTEIKE